MAVFLWIIRRKIICGSSTTDLTGTVRSVVLLGSPAVPRLYGFWKTVVVWVDFSAVNGQTGTVRPILQVILFWQESLLYSFFVLVTIKKQKPSLERGLNGSWLLFVVSAQALSILGSVVHPHLHIPVDVSIFINLFFYLLGVLFYIILIGIIFYRTTFVLMKADEFKPSYWIDMGAAAITTLSGILLIKIMGSVPIFQEYIPTLKVLSILFWIAGTWWIPAIIFLEIWRQKSISLKYNAGYWSLVFPLGVYTACTWQLAEEAGFSFLKWISSVFIYIAWFAWLITFIAMCIKVIGKYFLNRSLPKLD